MKSSSKKMAAEITSALTEATLVKSSGKKIMKKIDDTAKKLANKINKRISATSGKTQNIILKKLQMKAIKAEKKVDKKNESEVAT